MRTASPNLAPGRAVAFVVIALACICPSVGADAVADYCARGRTLYAQGRLAEALAAFQAALKANPRSDEARTGLGVVLYAQKKLDQAIAHWREAAKLNPRNHSAYTNLGAALNDKGRYAEAAAACRAALAVNPNSVGAHYNLGRALYRQKQIALAVREYEAAVRLNPSFAQAWLALGIAHANGTKNSREAVRCFERYLKLTPNPPECTCWVKAYIQKHK